MKTKRNDSMNPGHRILLITLFAGLVGAGRVPAQPATILFGITNSWRYNQADNLDGVNWTAPSHDDSVWPSGPGLLYVESNVNVTPRNTLLMLGRITYYFRTHFNFPSNTTNVSLVFSNRIDDGAVFYLNGAEIKRLRMHVPFGGDPAIITYSSLAHSSPCSGDSDFYDVFILSGDLLTNLVTGDNVLAVEVHQSSVSSSDVVFGSALSAVTGPQVVMPTGFQWAFAAGGDRAVDGAAPSVEHGRGIAVDRSGNVYVTGFFYGVARFGTNFLATGQDDDAFVAKFDSTGKVLWARQVGSIGSPDEGYAIAVDGEGNSYVTVLYGGNQILVAKHDSAGDLLWTRAAGGPQADFGYGIAADGAGNCYVTGYFQGTAAFGSTNLTSAGSSDVFLTKYDSAGDVMWARRAGSTDYDSGRAIAVDSAGNCYLTGTFRGTATFGETNLSSAGGSDIFIAKYDAAGNVTWAQRAGGTGGATPGSESGYGIAADSAGNCYVTGIFLATAAFGETNLTTTGGTDIFVAKYDSTGSVLWARRAGGTTGLESSYAIAVDSAGNSFVTGSFMGTIAIGGTNLTGGAVNGFLAKYDSAGNGLWAQAIGGPCSSAGYSIAADQAGNCYLTGAFTDTGIFGPFFLNSVGFLDIFVAKYSEALAPLRPELAIERLPSNARVLWPLPATDFILECATNLLSATNTVWSQVPFPYQTNATDISITAPASNGNKFYRLRKP